VALLAAPLPALLEAQEERPPETPTIVISGAGRPKIPIAMPAFDGGAGARERDAAVTLHDVVRDDLLFSNYFQLVPEEYLKLVGPFRDHVSSYKEWQGIGAEAVLVGQARAEQGTGIVFEGRAYDTSEQRLALGKRYRADADQTRLLAHRMSDELVQRYTGKRGIATTRIAYVSQVGKGKELFIMDYDGARAKRITANGSINRSPAWSPDGTYVAFVTLKSGQPQLMTLSASGDPPIPAFPQQGELNSAPAWSPDGRLLAFSSGRDGNAEIYTVRLADKHLTRLTRHDAIDTSPAWSPDGRSIAFTSDRGGSPQIYIMDAGGGGVRRLTGELSYCDSPSWSVGPSEAIAFTARVPGGFDIFAYDLKAGTLSRLTDGGGINESPRWSPDGRHVVFASNRSGGFDIYTMDANGDHVRRLTRGGLNESPTWSN
jgi:TolB protein